MGLLSSKPVKTLAEKIAEVKGTFVKAHKDALNLQTEINSELETDALAVASAKQKLEETEKFKKDNEKFIINLEKFI
jgi:hypothetical protein